MENPNPLSADAQKRIEEIAAQISVANELDSEIQSELRSHLEEKFLAYLSGQEMLSQDDALLLTRAHFGNAATIKSLFRRTHAIAHQLSLGRRLIAAALVMIVVSAITTWSFELVCHYLSASVAAAAGPQTPTAFRYFEGGISLATKLLKSLLLWGAFAWWRRGMARGRRYWFETWSIYTLLFVLAALWYLCNMMIGFSFTMPGAPHGRALPNTQLGAIGLTFSISNYLFHGLNAVLWIWWFDQVPYSRRVLVYAAASWLAMYAATTAGLYIPMYTHVRFPPADHFLLFLFITQLHFLLFELAVASLALAAYLLYRRLTKPASLA